MESSQKEVSNSNVAPALTRPRSGGFYVSAANMMARGSDVTTQQLADIAEKAIASVPESKPNSGIALRSTRLTTILEEMEECDSNSVFQLATSAASSSKATGGASK